MQGETPLKEKGRKPSNIRTNFDSLYFYNFSIKITHFLHIWA